MGTSIQRSAKKRPDAASRPADRHAVTAQWAGPLPPPSTLSSFEDVVEGSAERIVRMAELEQAHRHQAENSMLEADKSVIRRGHWLGFCVSISAIGASAFTAWIGAHWSVSVALVGLPITAIVKDLVNRKR